MPGWTSIATRRASGDSARSPVGFEQFVGERGHGVDLGVAGADQRHGLAGRRELQRVARAGLFVAEREAVLGLAEAQIGDEIEIEAVADPVGRGIERT